MLFKFSTVKSVTDEAERQQRLAQLYAIFEKTAPDDILADESDAATEATTQATWQGEHTTRRAAGQTEVSK